MKQEDGADSESKHLGGRRDPATGSPRQRFLECVREPATARAVVSPFCPHPEVVSSALAMLGLPITDDPYHNEFRLAEELDYEPMVFAPCSPLIFPNGTSQWGTDSQYPIQGEEDFDRFIWTCEDVDGREDVIRQTYRDLRDKVGDHAVILIDHPHISWLGLQAGQQDLFFLYADFPDKFRSAMDALATAAEFVFAIALEEGIDFLSEASYGLEMISPEYATEVDLPYLCRLSEWTHQNGGLFWYHNCGASAELIRNGFCNKFKPDVLETIAPPPEGDNDLEESRRHLDGAICSKGNLSLVLLREGTPNQVKRATTKMVESARGYAHIYSTADAVLPGTPAENLVTFVRTARAESTR